MEPAQNASTCPPEAAQDESLEVSTSSHNKEDSTKKTLCDQKSHVTKNPGKGGGECESKRLTPILGSCRESPQPEQSETGDGESAEARLSHEDSSSKDTSRDSSGSLRDSTQDENKKKRSQAPGGRKKSSETPKDSESPEILPTISNPSKTSPPCESDPDSAESCREKPTTSGKNSEKSKETPVSSKPSSPHTDGVVALEETSSSSKPGSPLDESSKSPGSEPKPSEDDKIESVTLDSDLEKDEDKDREPEKTEFVQISQDKPDDNPLEGPSEAEDPFGGDTLAADNVDTMDTDDNNERDINFSKLGDQADNLQDAVKATSSKETSSTPTESDNLQDPESSKKSSDAEEVEEVSEGLSEAQKSQDKSDKSSEKVPQSEVHVIPLETDEHSTVLPGQDDELCIIPDDMKIIIPGKSGSKKDPPKAPEPAAPEKPSVKVSKLAKAPEHSNKSKSSDATSAAITDKVIDLDIEVKSSEEISEITLPEKHVCKQCQEEKPCKIKVKIGSEEFRVCSKRCQSSFMDTHGKATDIPSEGANSKYEKRCASCLLIVESNDERNLSWETMEFCNEECLGKFQTKYGSYCRNCNGNVQPISLGKYCVRFGFDVRQFCCSTCLEEFKKGLKVCSYCQKDISSGTDGFLAPVGDKGQFKDFCTQQCMEKYSRMNSTEPPPTERKACSVCQEEKIVFCEVQIDRGQSQAICSEPCFAAFKFVNKVDPDHCATCKKYFQVGNKKSTVVFYNNEAHTFCSKSCLNIFIITNRKIVPCNWCKVKKYNFDMIKKELKSGQVVMMCSLNCLTLYQVSINAVSARRIRCDLCKEFSQAQYHLTMSDATIRNFCSYNCVMKFQAQYTKSPITIPSGEDAPVPTGMPKRTYPGKVQPLGVVKKVTDMQNASLQSKKSLPVISSVASLASLPSNGQPAITQKATNNVVNLNSATITNPTAVPGTPILFKQQVITRPPSPVQMHNKMTQCKPLMHTKGVSVKPHPCTKSTQTDEIQKVIIPIPVPIYVPFPVHMFSFPFPVPMPFPLPIPVPIFIPTTRNSAKGIFKELKKIQEKLPSDPFEAELLMMAEMVATDKKKTESDSESDDNGNENENVEVSENAVEEKQDPVDGGNAFGEEMLQMALKMATGELEEPAVDLEAALTPSTIAATPQGQGDGEENQVERQTRGRKRTVTHKAKGANKKGKRSASTGEPPLMPPPESQTPTRTVEPLEKPDANMALKFTFGVNAWRQWVITKNAEMEKNAGNKIVKPFKTDLLQLTADELNYSLCLFLKEVRKPNGAEYAPDTIYYLCLGIQQYLFKNNRIDNIFTDSYYEKFTDCLNEVATKFSVLYNEAHYIVTRVEEEHLWECKQLGAHSPHVLLSTLMFFNTKHFNLTTVEEHMQLSFSHIMKHWKRNPAAQAAAGAGKPPGARNVLLRFYPPQAALEANSRKKKVYEQQENEENPLRCPVKLYEFYLSKCPESVKSRNDVFYLLPERSCVPDSPVWYSTSPLAKDHLVKMLNRVKMVKEINVALWSS
ncbi:zinc finger MYM-type protein 3 [Fopius arisanus]|uniref:ZMYM3 protein n=1 Tax=Fopius arisanus TaxID=64838 RepID=A0A0C9S0P9_9HYME|nr:PREDICTED: zinc finger MYM-type protein 3 [Fopius arisanus]XP_011304780.1 PREDICTED: zinc finger MYM-type protein 3 [Fopius arisanus]